MMHGLKEVGSSPSLENKTHIKGNSKWTLKRLGN
jgi:hypothetical protein